MTLLLTFNPREHQRLIKSWQQYYKQLKLSFEPGYRVAPQTLITSETGEPLLLTSWLNGRATILPPADIVSIVLYEPERQALRAYLIRQPELFEALGWLLKLESFPTRYFQIDALTEADARAVMPKVLAKATLASERPLVVAETDLPSITAPSDTPVTASASPIPAAPWRASYTPAPSPTLADQRVPQPVTMPHRHRLA